MQGGDVPAPLQGLPHDRAPDEPRPTEHQQSHAPVAWLLLQATTLVAHVHPDDIASAVTAHRLGITPTPVLLDGEVEWRGLLFR